MITVVTCFIYGFLIDILYCLWIWGVNRSRYHLASFCTLGIAACSSLGFLDIVDNRWYLIPYLTGIYCGTWAGIWFKDWLEARPVAHEEQQTQ